MLSGCSQIVQFAGDAAGVDVQQVCATADDAYTQYQRLLEQGDVTGAQVGEARDALVLQLEGIADGVGGTVGDFIRSNGQRLVDMGDVSVPEAIAAAEKAKSALDTLCG